MFAFQQKKKKKNEIKVYTQQVNNYLPLTF